MDREGGNKEKMRKCLGFAFVMSLSSSVSSFFLFCPLGRVVVAAVGASVVVAVVVVVVDLLLLISPIRQQDIREPSF